MTRRAQYLTLSIETEYKFTRLRHETRMKRVSAHEAEAQAIWLRAILAVCNEAVYPDLYAAIDESGIITLIERDGFVAGRVVA